MLRKHLVLVQSLRICYTLVLVTLQAVSFGNEDLTMATFYAHITIGLRHVDGDAHITLALQQEWFVPSGPAGTRVVEICGACGHVDTLLIHLLCKPVN